MFFVIIFFEFGAKMPKVRVTLGTTALVLVSEMSDSLCGNCSLDFVVWQTLHSMKGQESQAKMETLKVL